MSNMSQYTIFSEPEITIDPKKVIIEYECQLCYYSGEISYKVGVLKEGIDSTGWCQNCHANFSIPKRKIDKIIKLLQKIKEDNNGKV